MTNSRPKLLLGLTGMNIDGGIAVVSRCVGRMLDESMEALELARADRVLLLDDYDSPPNAPRNGDQSLARGSKGDRAFRPRFSSKSE